MFKVKVLNLKSIIIMLYIVDFDCYKFVFMSKFRILIKLGLILVIRIVINEIVYL